MCRTISFLSDMDGVFADLEGMVIRILRREFPWVKIPNPWERTTFYLDEQIAPEHRHLVAEIIRRPGFFLSLEPIPGAIEAMNRISNIPGVNFVICTSPLKDPTFCVPEKYEWVDRYLPKFLKNMVLTRDKTLVDGVYLLEDNPDVTGSKFPTWKLVLHDQPHNRHSKIQRISWDERTGPGYRWLYEMLQFEWI